MTRARRGCLFENMIGGSPLLLLRRSWVFVNEETYIRGSACFLLIYVLIPHAPRAGLMLLFFVFVSCLSAGLFYVFATAAVYDALVRSLKRAIERCNVAALAPRGEYK